MSTYRQDKAGLVKFFKMKVVRLSIVFLSTGLFLSCFSLAIGQFCLDINTADKEELSQIRHIGEARAEQIIALRQQQPFVSVDDLSRVAGIGPARIADIKEQGLACVKDNALSQLPRELVPIATKPAEKDSLQPKIIINTDEFYLIDQELVIRVITSNLEDSFYDIKISLERDNVISRIYNPAADKWQSSHYYINRLLAGPSFDHTFRLKIREENIMFPGKADLVVRLRKSGQSNYLERREIITLSEPRPDDSFLKPKKETADLSQSLAHSHEDSWKIFLFAFGLALVSAIIILLFKQKLYSA